MPFGYFVKNRMMAKHNYVCEQKQRKNVNKTTEVRRNLKIFSFFEILRLTNFVMIPLTILYDEQINRRKLTEQKIS